MKDILKQTHSIKHLQHLIVIIVISTAAVSCNISKQEQPKWGNWYRPVDNPVFTSEHNNNHDPIIFVDTTLEYPYHLIISGWECNPQNDNNPQTYLWRSKTFSWSSNDWQLVSENYRIGCHYEYDDGVKVGNKYFIYEDGKVYTYEGSLEQASGQWIEEGTFPKHLGDDVGVYYEDETFHLFGEYGDFPHGPDGTSLSHLTSKTGIGDWEFQDSLAVNPNLDNGNTFGVGDPTIIKINNEYFLYCDIESKGKPYRIIAWKAKSLYERFKKLGVTMSPREGETVNWDDHRIQDGDIAFIPEISNYVMVCNMKDTDGSPGGDFPRLSNFTRVVGFFYSENGIEEN